LLILRMKLSLCSWHWSRAEFFFWILLVCRQIIQVWPMISIAF
jgi:hypothetical protein